MNITSLGPVLEKKICLKASGVTALSVKSLIVKFHRLNKNHLMKIVKSQNSEVKKVKNLMSMNLPTTKLKRLLIFFYVSFWSIYLNWCLEWKYICFCIELQEICLRKSVKTWFKSEETINDKNWPKINKKLQELMDLNFKQ